MEKDFAPQECAMEVGRDYNPSPGISFADLVLKMEEDLPASNLPLTTTTDNAVNWHNSPEIADATCVTSGLAHMDVSQYVGTMAHTHMRPMLTQGRIPGPNFGYLNTNNTVIRRSGVVAVNSVRTIQERPSYMPVINLNVPQTAGSYSTMFGGMSVSIPQNRYMNQYAQTCEPFPVSVLPIRHMYPHPRNICVYGQIRAPPVSGREAARSLPSCHQPRTPPFTQPPRTLSQETVPRLLHTMNVQTHRSTQVATTVSKEMQAGSHLPIVLHTLRFNSLMLPSNDYSNDSHNERVALVNKDNRICKMNEKYIDAAFITCVICNLIFPLTEYKMHEHYKHHVKGGTMQRFKKEKSTDCDSA